MILLRMLDTVAHKEEILQTCGKLLLMGVVDCMLSFCLILGFDSVFRPGVRGDYPASEWSFIFQMPSP